jgi:hypothetical protein
MEYIMLSKVILKYMTILKFFRRLRRLAQIICVYLRKSARSVGTIKNRL